MGELILELVCYVCLYLGNENLGIAAAAQQFKALVSKDKNSNRIIFLTGKLLLVTLFTITIDGIPTSGEEADMLRMSKQNAEEHIYTTFIGLGIDFNTDLV